MSTPYTPERIDEFLRAVNLMLGAGEFKGNCITDFATTVIMARQLQASLKTSDETIANCKTHIEMLVDKNVQTEIGINADDVEHVRDLDQRVLRICTALYDKQQYLEAQQGEIELLQQQLKEAKEQG